jgi:hypothetical protein
MLGLPDQGFKRERATWGCLIKSVEGKGHLGLPDQGCGRGRATWGCLIKEVGGEGPPGVA